MSTPQIKRKPAFIDSLSGSMNEDWRHMFGKSLGKSTTAAKSKKLSAIGGTASASGLSDSASNPADMTLLYTSGSQQQSTDSQYEYVSPMTTDLMTSSAVEHTTEVGDKSGTGSNALPRNPHLQTIQARCNVKFKEMLWHKARMNEQTCAGGGEGAAAAGLEQRLPPAGWKPKGLLVAHLHEHRGAVNRIKVRIKHKCDYPF